MARFGLQLISGLSTNEAGAMNMTTSWRAISTLGCLLLAFCQGAWGDVSVTIKGVVLMPPPCVVNAGGTLNVPFGTGLLTTKINGVNYSKSVPYTVTCGPQPTNFMTLRLTGTGAGFDSSALGTSKSNLGIRLLVGGVAWPLNTTVNFTYPNLPDVKVVLVKKTGSTLTGGTFSAAATLVVALR